MTAPAVIAGIGADERRQRDEGDAERGGGRPRAADGQADQAADDERSPGRTTVPSAGRRRSRRPSGSCRPCSRSPISAPTASRMNTAPSAEQTPPMAASRTRARRVPVLERDERRRRAALVSRATCSGPPVASVPKRAMVSAMRPIRATTGISASSSDGARIAAPPRRLAGAWSSSSADRSAALSATPRSAAGRAPPDAAVVLPAPGEQNSSTISDDRRPRR